MRVVLGGRPEGIPLAAAAEDSSVARGGRIFQARRTLFHLEDGRQKNGLKEEIAKMVLFTWQWSPSQGSIQWQ